ncbi:MAG: PQQ-binding-like beta-propeller repeat protein [Acidobacteriota bacterium]
MHLLTRLFVVVVCVGTGAVGFAQDWPQWRGPDRTGVSAETGLLRQWPGAGPALVWSVSGLGRGYGSMAIRGDVVYLQGTQGDKSVVFAVKRSNGATIWTSVLGKTLDQDKGGGPRGTPTLDGDRLYALSENGDLACLRQGDGGVAWKRNILTDFGGTNPKWLISESPLVDGDNLIVTPGGRGAGIVALNKLTGKTVWAAAELNDPAAYSSCIVAVVDGVRTIMTITAQAGVGVRASDGKLLWRYARVANKTANVTTPVFLDNAVFYTSAYDTGGALLRLKAEAGGVKADEAYFTRDMMNHHGGVVLLKGYLYGFSNAVLTCVEFATGKVMWRDRSVGKGTVTAADGLLFLMGEGNTVGLAQASPEAYQEKGRFSIADQGWPSWAHLVVAGGKLYVRNQGVLAVYNVKAR